MPIGGILHENDGIIHGGKDFGLRVVERESDDLCRSHIDDWV
jgi:hypothetical protein